MTRGAARLCCCTVLSVLAVLGCSGAPPTGGATTGGGTGASSGGSNGGGTTSGGGATTAPPSGVPSCQTLTFMHEPPRDWGGTRVPDICQDAQGRTGYEQYGNCEVPEQEQLEICNLCRVDADCAARPEGRCIGVQVNGPPAWGGYPQCVYPDDPGHPSHAPPCPAPGAVTPAPTQYVSVSWRVECIAPRPGEPCRWGTCTRHENRALP